MVSKSVETDDTAPRILRILEADRDLSTKINDLHTRYGIGAIALNNGDLNENAPGIKYCMRG